MMQAHIASELRASVQQSYGFDPQDYFAELAAIDKFLKISNELIASNDVKIVISQHLQKFLQQLDSVTNIVKSKQQPANAIDYFKSKVRTYVDQEGVKLFEMLKEVILVRQRDRQIRELSIRAIKRLFKIAGKCVAPMLHKLKIHIFISFILEREYKSSAVAKERQQCFKFIQMWLRVDAESFPLFFAQSTVGLVKNDEENQLRQSGIELMIEMCSKAPRIAAQVGAIKLLIDCLMDLSLEGFRYERISHALMLLINDPKIRVFFRPFVDLNKILSIFTRPDGVEVDQKKPSLERSEAQMKLAKIAIVNMMRSWQGVIYLTSSKLGLSSLVEALNQPIRLQKKIAILDIFIEIFNVPIFLGGSETNSNTGDYMLLGGFGKSDNLLNNYIALLLQSFYHCGAYEALTMLGTTAEEGSQLNRQSKAFLKKIIYLSSHLLPEVPQFPQLIHIATDFSAFDQHSTRTRAAKLVKELSTVALRNPLEFNHQSELMRGSNLGPNDFSQFFMSCYDYMGQVKLGMPQTQIFSNNLVDLKSHYYSEAANDEVRFQAKVKATKLQTEKDWTKWNWEIIHELLDGQLITQQRLEGLYKVKFIKRLLKFYLPDKQTFINLPWKQENLRYAKCGYLLIKRLIHDKRGRKVLSSEEELIQFLGIPFYEQNDQLFQLKRTFMQSIQELLKSEVQYVVDKNNKKRKTENRSTTSNIEFEVGSKPQQASNFGQVLESPGLSKQQPLSKQASQVASSSKFAQQIGASSGQRWFTKTRLNETMTREVISWLGLLSMDKKGQKLLKKFGVYEYLEKLIDLDGYYDHLILLMLNSFLFSQEDLAKKMLIHWSNNSSPLLSKNIVEYFRLIYRSEYFFYDWCLPLLLQQASINDKQVRAMAFDVLEEACQDEGSLNLLIQKCNGDIGQDLLKQGDVFALRFMRSELGFNILYNKGVVAEKLAYWYEVANYQYIQLVEQTMYNGLNLHQINGQDSDHALHIWIPIFDHSNDYRQELALLKRFPFSIMLKIESQNLRETVEERMQTYFDITLDNEIQIVGRLVPGHSRAGRISLEELGDGYISVCPKLGATYVDSKCRPNEVASWTMSQIDKQVRDRLTRNNKQSTFFVMKDGISFVFQKQLQTGSNGASLLSQFFLDSVIFRVKILPEKHKTIKNPTHFYGELVKTHGGATFLRKVKHLEKFKQDILSPDTSLLQKRAALWAIGHIGSNEHGIKLVLEQELVQPIIKLAENAEVLSLRGTCIYIIGMLSNTSIGRSAIQKHQWICSKTKGITAVCLPRDPRTLFTVAPYKYEGSVSGDERIARAFAILKSQIPLKPEEEDVIKNIGNLLNSVYEVQAISELRKKLDQNAELFNIPRVFEHVCLLLQVYRFRPKGRKFIFNLFENLIFSNLIDKQVYYQL